jgi:hypothetical protein
MKTLSAGKWVYEAKVRAVPILCFSSQVSRDLLHMREGNEKRSTPELKGSS